MEAQLALAAEKKSAQALLNQNPRRGHAEFYRFFIELPLGMSGTISRSLQRTERQRVAREFVGLLREWLQESGLGRLVSYLDVTALGQVQLVCHSEVIEAIRNQDTFSIVAIRSARDISDKLAAIAESLR